MTVEALLSETDWLRALCRQLVQEEDHAEDLFQETVLASIVSANQPKGGLRPWLTGIAQNLVANRKRAEQRRRQREQAAARPDPGPSPSDTENWVAMQQEVIQAVRELPYLQREVLLLRYFEDLPPREIAERLGVPVGTAKTRLKRGLEALRRRFDDEHGGRNRWLLIMVPFVGGPDGTPPTAYRTAEPTTVWATGAAGRVAAVAALITATTTVWVLTLPSDEQVPGAFSESVAEGPRADKVGASTMPPRPSNRSRVPSAEGRSSEAGRGTFEVEVFEEGRPVEGAVLHYARIDQGAVRPPNHAELESALEQRGMSYASFLDAVSSTTRSNAAGQADLDLSGEPGARLRILAEFGNSEALVEIDEEELGKSPTRLELRCRPFVDVRVLGPDGRPVAGVPVDYLFGAVPYCRAVSVGSAGPLRLWIPFADSQWLSTGTVRIALPLGEAVTAAAPAGISPGEPIRLQLPATAAIRIEVVDPGGRPLPSGEVLVYPERAVIDGHAEAVETDRVARARVEDGEAWLAHVGLGTAWRVSVLPDGYVERWSFRVTAPARAGEVGAARLQAPLDRARVAVQLGSLESPRLCGLPIELEIRNDGGRVIRHRVISDRAGLICLPCEPGQDHARMTLSVVDPERAGAAPLGVLLDLPRLEESQPMLFLEALLRPMDPLVAGRVVDWEGRPVSGATVRLSSPESAGLELSASSDRQGRFAFYGLGRSNRFHVVAARDDHVAASQDWVMRGETALRLELRQGRPVTGTVVCAGVERQLDCRLRAVSADSRQSGVSAIQSDGSFSFAAVPAGRYSLELRTLLDGSLLHSQAIDVAPGDAPLEIPALDVARHATLVRLTVTDPGGRPPSELLVTTRHTDASPGMFCMPDADGQIYLIVPPEGLDLSVEAVGYEPSEIDKLAADREITLSPLSHFGRPR